MNTVAERRQFEMSKGDLKTILDACKSVPAIALQCGPIQSPQENANRAWRELGLSMGFVWDTVHPVQGASQRVFTAVPRPESSPIMNTPTPSGLITASPVPFSKIVASGLRGPAGLHADWMTENPDLWLCGAEVLDDANNVVGILTAILDESGDITEPPEFWGAAMPEADALSVLDDLGDLVREHVRDAEIEAAEALVAHQQERRIV